MIFGIFLFAAQYKNYCQAAFIYGRGFAHRDLKVDINMEVLLTSFESATSELTEDASTSVVLVLCLRASLNLTAVTNRR